MRACWCEEWVKGRPGGGGGVWGCHRVLAGLERTLALSSTTSCWRSVSNDPSALILSRIASVSRDDDGGTVMSSLAPAMHGE